MTTLCKVERFSDGSPMKFTSIGLYPIFYIREAACDHGLYCPMCAARAEDRGDDMTGCGANWEDPDLYCDDCGDRIESAYGED